MGEALPLVCPSGRKGRGLFLVHGDYYLTSRRLEKWEGRGRYGTGISAIFLVHYGYPDVEEFGE
jgi:hypothetical protein